MSRNGTLSRDHRARRLREAVADLAVHVPPPRDLLDEVTTRLRGVVPFDGGGWWASDPETLLPAELWEFDYPELWREVADSDVNRLDDLDRAGQSAASLSLATDGVKTRSPRFVAHHHPAGIGDEMRVLSRSGGRTWGSACLVRGSDLPDFSREEVALVAAISRDVGQALRIGLLRAMTSDRPDPATRASATGSVILGADDSILGYTAEGAEALTRIGARQPTRQIPTALRWIALQARARKCAEDTAAAVPVRAARSRIRSTDGTLMSVSAEVLHGAVDQSVLMTFEPVTGPALLPLLAALHGLTERETQVVRALVRGQTVNQTASELHLSIHTVRDHIKSVYARLGVRSRPELTAIFTVEAA